MVKKIPAETYFGEKILANSDAEKKKSSKIKWSVPNADRSA